MYLLVDAACELAREFPELQLRLLGRGEPAIVAELQTRAQFAGLPDLLDMPGFVDRAELPAHFARAHIFAAPSQYEGGPGFVYLEAMACGLPVIACAGSGAAEVIAPEQTGLLVPAEDVVALIEVLRRLLSNDTLRASMGERARRYVLEHAESGVCIARIEAFYAQHASRSR